MFAFGFVVFFFCLIVVIYTPKDRIEIRWPFVIALAVGAMLMFISTVIKLWSVMP